MTFLGTLLAVLLFVFHEKHKDDGDSSNMKVFVKALPYVAIFWLLHSVTTLICVGIIAFDTILVENAGGYITLIIFSWIFTCTWIQIAYAYVYYVHQEYGENRGESIMNRPGN